ncbi:response regulator transcription factor [Psychrobacillus sp. OK032]|uniref:response regulator transcription factor n=1 Tax=Psychrobacillus sp. OK032 TaxID=1884358 RepID=UPI0008C0A04B|nr:response regulator transcription factor [Psychrobacillus sp. OK032]SES45404.1 two component transcriptional regulator, LuxR family [Psychrobacillus sp. OK032]
MIRILIAEDQQMVRSAFTSLLQFEQDIDVIAAVSDGEIAYDSIRQLDPDVCILDIEMPYLSGLEVARKVRENQLPCKIIIVTTFARPGYLQKAMDAQVEGYLLKDEPIDFLIQSIRRVMKGERVISTDLSAVLFMQEKNPLSEREADVLRLTKDGLTTDDISKTLFLTKGTVRNYVSSAIQKLEAESRSEAVQIALEKGWVE